ncbi:MAG TPA: hypothetical protein VF797_04595, partial [Noviherbaspirillum sp.]
MLEPDCAQSGVSFNAASLLLPTDPERGFSLLPARGGFWVVQRTFMDSAGRQHLVNMAFFGCSDGQSRALHPYSSNARQAFYFEMVMIGPD